MPKKGVAKASIVAGVAEAARASGGGTKAPVVKGAKLKSKDATPAPAAAAAVVVAEPSKTGTRHQSADDKRNASSTLDGVIATFLHTVSKLPKAVREDEAQWGKLIRDAFTPAQRSALWGRFASDRAGAPKDVAEAWKRINAMGRSKGGDQKHLLLSEFMSGRPGQWQSKLLTMVNSLEIGQEKKTVSVPMTRGELEFKIGEEVTHRQIDKGTLVPMEDSDDETVFVKREKSYTETETRKRKIETNRFVFVIFVFR